MARKNRRSYGSGCVIKRGKGFTIRWRETLVRSDGTKTTVYRCEALGAVSKKKANSVLSERMAAAQTRVHTVMTFNDLGAIWKRTVLPFYKHSSRQVREATLNKLLSRFDAMDLDSVTRQEIQTYVAELSRMNYAPHSVHHVHSVLSAILGKAVKWGHLRENPAQGVDLPKLVCKRPKWVLTPDQAQRLLETLTPMPRTLVGLSLLTGMRRGEVLAARWQCFDEVNGISSVNEAVYRDHFDTPKTERSRRQIPLPPLAVELLAGWKQITKRAKPEDLIFGTRAGKPHSPSNILRRHIFPACERLGMPHATWLTFRRTYSSWCHNKGIPDKVTAELMGHTNVRTTLDVYTQVVPGSRHVVAERVGSELIANWSQNERGEPFGSPGK